MEPERMVLRMPSDPEAFIAAVAVISCYQIMYAARKLPIELFITNVDHTNDFLFNTLPNDEGHTFLPPPADTDLDFTFDVQRARAIAATGNLHVAEAFGIMLGVDQPFPYPDMLKLDDPDIKNCIGLFHTGRWKEQASGLRELLFTNAPELDLLELPDDTATLLGYYEMVRGCHTVIGPPSAATYLAAASGRNVIELITNGVQDVFYAKPLRSNVILVDASASESLLWNIIRRQRWDYTVAKVTQ